MKIFKKVKLQFVLILVIVVAMIEFLTVSASIPMPSKLPITSKKSLNISEFASIISL